MTNSQKILLGQCGVLAFVLIVATVKVSLPGASAAPVPEVEAPACSFPYDMHSTFKSVFCVTPTQCLECREQIEGTVTCRHFDGWKKCVTGSRTGVTQVQ